MTSSNMDSNRIAKQIKQKLMHRKNCNTLAGSSNQIIPSFGPNLPKNTKTYNSSSGTGYITNSEIQSIILHILNSESRYREMRLRDEGQFERVKEKVLANTSVIVLKWYKTLQDQLYD